MARCKEAHLFGPLCSILGASLLAIGDALRVEHAADDVIAHARQVLDPAAADHHHGMLLQVVAFARDVADHLKAVGQAYLGDLAQRRIGLLRGRRVDARADAPLLRTRLHMACLFAVGLLRPRFADQLLNGRHAPRSPLPATDTSSYAKNPPRRYRLSGARLAYSRGSSRLLAQTPDLGLNCPLLDDGSV